MLFFIRLTPSVITSSVVQKTMRNHPGSVQAKACPDKI
jgi:hypothetical protein